MFQKIFLLGVLFLVSMISIHADTNGVWTYSEDIRAGVFGADEGNSPGSNYTFNDMVYFNQDLIYKSELIEDLFVNTSGDTMSGNLDMDNNRITNLPSPSGPNQPTTLEYSDNNYVNEAGDSMSGNLDMGGNTISNINRLITNPSTSDYLGGVFAESYFTRGAGTSYYLRPAGNSILNDVEIGGDLIYNGQLIEDFLGDGGINTSEGDARYVNKDGDTMTGNLRIDTSSYPQLAFGDGSKFIGEHSGSDTLQIRTQDSSPIQFKTNGNNVRMSIEGNGRVGIGTTSPQKALHIVEGDYNRLFSIERPSVGALDIAPSGNQIRYIPHSGANRHRFFGDVQWDGTLLSGTVPWARLSGYPSINAGTGLSGGGSLSSSRTINLDTSYSDNRYVNEGQSNSISDEMIQDGAVTSSKIASNSVRVQELDTSSVDNRYVNRAGDTMTGVLRMGGNNIWNPGWLGMNGSDIGMGGGDINMEGGNLNNANDITATGEGQFMRGTGSVMTITEYEINGVLGPSLQTGSTPLSIRPYGFNDTLINPTGLGNVGIGTLNPTSKLHVGGDVRIDGAMRSNLNMGGNNIENVGDLTYSSDRRLKENFENLSQEEISNIIENLEPIRYNFKNSSKEEIGLIAQEVKEIVPELVSEGEDGYLGIDYARLTPILIEHMKTQQKEIEDIEDRLNKLEEKLED